MAEQAEELALLVQRATRAKLVRKVLLGNEDQLAKEVLLVLSDHKALLALSGQRETMESVALLARGDQLESVDLSVLRVKMVRREILAL